ncbi:MAG: 2-oxo acid dehydrogenase subunit E2 [Desulfobacterales bacterium]|nr:MAG: 2-oxo acid dehydrogenase subunit E2 [Desulfobacterales bacterium]
MATEVVIPMLGVTVEKGIIVEWIKQEGDPVARGESLFVVEADKVTTEVESPATGILAKILIPAGQEVPVLTVVGLITEAGEAIPDEYKARPAAPAAEHGAAALAAASAGARSAPSASAIPRGPIAIVPAARKLAREKGLDLATIAASGPGGVILLRDVAAAAAAPGISASTLARRFADRKGVALAGMEGTGVRGRIMRADVERTLIEAQTPGLGKIIPMDRMRQVIARRMSTSAFTAPHIYFFTDVRMDPLLNFRREILPDFEKAFDLKPSINDFLIKAVALNILDFPILNATVKDQEIHIAPEVNVGLAVALDDGLIVPAITNADRAGLVDIIRQRMDLVKRARAGHLTMAELECGTFTVSSLAQYDITYFTAILNPPQSGILSVGKTRDELYLSDGGAVKTRQQATFGLSVDHRIIDGTVAADFLQNLKWKLERPTFTFLNL